MATDKRVVCILSNARSGSTALRSALWTSGAVKDFGEIFHDNRALTPFPFLDYLERWPDPLRAVLNWDEATRIARDYLDQLIFEAHSQMAVIDVKHNAWGALKPLWQFPHDTPVFLSALKAERAFFIQLKRDSLADQVISYHIAMESGVWHRQLVAADIPQSLRGKRFDPEVARRYASLFARAEALVDGFLEGTARRLTLVYEEAFSNGMLSGAAQSQLSKALEIDVRSTLLPQRPNAVDKREIVSNYDEICEVAALVRAFCR